MELDHKAQTESLEYNRETVLKEIVSILQEKKCEEIRVLNLENVNSYLSIFIICTVKSSTQGKAVSREVYRNLKKYKITSKSGQASQNSYESGWILMDLGEIFLHVMTAETRAFYNLDKLWGDAVEISV
ncbi:MAG: ribosome silencing factor [Spirochaetota bacterium]